MRAESDNTARVIVLTLCVFIVMIRLVRPQIEFDAYSLGALAVAALVAVVPVFARPRRQGGGANLSADDVRALKKQVESAGLLMADSTDAYTMLKETRPYSAAVAGAYTTLGLRLKALTEQARLESHGADAAGCLAVLNSAGITTGEQYEALMSLLRLLKTGSQEDFPADEQLLETAIGVIEMLDGTIG